MSQNKKLNISFSIVRAFAVISIVSAHVSIKEPEVISRLIHNFGSIGVTIFIILSGYFYHSEKYKNIFHLLKEKGKTIIIPWVAIGSFTYLYNAVLGGNLGIKQWLLWILGYRTYLYYLTVLIICYLVFYKRCKTVSVAAVIINVISIYLTAFGFLDNIIESLHLTNYLNIFNWLGYFSIGYMLQKADSQVIYDYLRRTKVFTIPLFLISYVLITIFNVETGYFSVVGMPYQLIGTLALAGLSTTEILDKKIVHTISNMTFGVYLIHMPVIGITDRLYGVSVATKLFAPIIVAGISLFILYAGYFVVSKLNLGDVYCTVTGIRMKRNIREEK